MVGRERGNLPMPLTKRLSGPNGQVDLSLTGLKIGGWYESTKLQTLHTWCHRNF